jgi:hypothetical protein
MPSAIVMRAGKLRGLSKRSHPVVVIGVRCELVFEHVRQQRLGFRRQRVEIEIKPRTEALTPRSAHGRYRGRGVSLLEVLGSRITTATGRLIER